MDNKRNVLKHACNFLCHPSSRYRVLMMVFVSLLSGVILWGGFNTAMDATNSLVFCISCHEMRDNVYPEYKRTIHYTNMSGVRAICSDCHVPKTWGYKLLRKMEATQELWDKIAGSVDTREKFEAHRLELANQEWARMKTTDSRECRNCHSLEAMIKAKGKRQIEVYELHKKSDGQGKTCIDYHKGIAHLLPMDYVEPEEA